MSKYRQAYAPEFRRQLVDLVHAGRSANAEQRQYRCIPVRGHCQTSHDGVASLNPRRSN